MTNEALKPHNPEGPKIINTTILVNGGERVIPTVDGKPHREGETGKLGKRYICAQEQVTISVSEIIDPGTGKPKITETFEILSGEFKNKNDKEGKSINLGCGTEILCTKASASANIPTCCNLPMTVEHPKPIPGSD
jgi:hypothetical protein